MAQFAKNLTDPFDGFLMRKRFLILDRDTKYSGELRRTLKISGVTPRLLPHRSPNRNALAERFVRSIKDECPDRLILFSELSLRHTIDQFIEHLSP